MNEIMRGRLVKISRVESIGPKEDDGFAAVSFRSVRAGLE